MWWLILYIIPIFICMLGCLWIVKTEGKTTRRDLFAMLLLFVPVINFFGAVVIICESFKSKKFQTWLDGVVVDHTKTEEPK